MKVLNKTLNFLLNRLQYDILFTNKELPNFKTITVSDYLKKELKTEQVIIKKINFIPYSNCINVQVFTNVH